METVTDAPLWEKEQLGVVVSVTVGDGAVCEGVGEAEREPDGLPVEESAGVGVAVRVSEAVGEPREMDRVLLCVDGVMLPVSVGSRVGVVEYDAVDCDALPDGLRLGDCVHVFVRLQDCASESVPVRDGWVMDPVVLALQLSVGVAVYVSVTRHVGGDKVEDTLIVVLGDKGDKLLDRDPVWELVGGRL